MAAANRALAPSASTMRTTTAGTATKNATWWNQPRSRGRFAVVTRFPTDRPYLPGRRRRLRGIVNIVIRGREICRRVRTVLNGRPRRPVVSLRAVNTYQEGTGREQIRDRPANLR